MNNLVAAKRLRNNCPKSLADRLLQRRNPPFSRPSAGAPGPTEAEAALKHTPRLSLVVLVHSSARMNSMQDISYSSVSTSATSGVFIEQESSGIHAPSSSHKRQGSQPFRSPVALKPAGRAVTATPAPQDVDEECCGNRKALRLYSPSHLGCALIGIQPGSRKANCTASQPSIGRRTADVDDAP